MPRLDPIFCSPQPDTETRDHRYGASASHGVPCLFTPLLLLVLILLSWRDGQAESTWLVDQTPRWCESNSTCKQSPISVVTGPTLVVANMLPLYQKNVAANDDETAIIYKPSRDSSWRCTSLQHPHDTSWKPNAGWDRSLVLSWWCESATSAREPTALAAADQVPAVRGSCPCWRVRLLHHPANYWHLGSSVCRGQDSVASEWRMQWKQNLQHPDTGSTAGTIATNNKHIIFT